MKIKAKGKNEATKDIEINSNEKNKYNIFKEINGKNITI